MRMFVVFHIDNFYIPIGKQLLYTHSEMDCKKEKDCIVPPSKEVVIIVYY